MKTQYQYIVRDLLRTIFGFKRETRHWYCCGFTVLARTRKNARRAFEQHGIAYFHARQNTRILP